jgi:hypothetical protein
MPEARKTRLQHGAKGARRGIHNLIPVAPTRTRGLVEVLGFFRIQENSVVDVVRLDRDLAICAACEEEGFESAALSPAG